jgi:hypothetical protein
MSQELQSEPQKVASDHDKKLTVVSTDKNSQDRSYSD